MENSSCLREDSSQSITNADDLAKVAVRLDLTEHEVRDIGA